MNCKNCNQYCCKWGRQRNGAQRFYCKACRKTQQEEYKYEACKPVTMKLLPKLVCESVGIRGIARILKIALATVVRKIKQIACRIAKPPIPLNCKEIELDEVKTYVGRKENQYWIGNVSN